MNRSAHQRTARLAAAIAMGAILGASALSACSSNSSDGSSTTPSVTQVGKGPTTTNGAGTPSGDGAPQISSVVAASVHEPIVLLARPGDDGHLWIAERAGMVRRLSVEDRGNTLADGDEPVLDISDQTTVESERGLLGMAFSTDGDTLYLSYTNTEGDSRVVSYEMDGNTVDATSRTELFSQDQPYPNHNGGNIAIGPDGLLWLGLGDGGAGDDPENNAQNPKVNLGKILTIDPRTRSTKVVISGVRNPWRWAFDTDGSLWIGDVGQNHIEEIDHLPAGEVQGANLGWSGYEGKDPYLDGEGRRPADPIAPVFEYPHEDGNCSITGGFAYRGSAIPALQGAFLFADYCAGRVRAITLAADGTLAHEYDLGVDVEQPISFGHDQAGEPYVLSATGNIVRLLPAD